MSAGVADETWQDPLLEQMCAKSWHKHTASTPILLMVYVKEWCYRINNSHQVTRKLSLHLKLCHRHRTAEYFGASVDCTSRQSCGGGGRRRTHEIKLLHCRSMMLLRSHSSNKSKSRSKHFIGYKYQHYEFRMLRNTENDVII